MSDDEALALLIERYLQGTLTPEERAALIERVQRDGRARETFELQVRLSVQVGSAIKPDDPEEARLRAAMIFAADSEAQNSKLNKSLEDRVGIHVPTRRRSLKRRGLSSFGKGMRVALLAASLLAAIVVVLSVSSREADRPREMAEKPKPLPAPPAPEVRPQPVPPVREEPKPPAPPVPLPEKPQAPPKPESPAPPPAPRPPDPKPEVPPPPPPREPPKPAPPQETRTVIARLDRMWGEVEIVMETGRAPAKKGQDIVSGQSLRTGDDGLAVLRYPDGTQVRLEPQGLLGAFTERAPAAAGRPARGWSVALSQGKVVADVARQPADQPMVFVTPHGEAKVLGTTLKLSVSDGTRLEVVEGKVQLKRAADGKTTDVSTGHFAVAAVGVELASKALPRPRLNPRLQSLPPNAWVHLKTARNPVGRAYSGVTYGDGLLFYFGGGGPHYGGNDMELFDVATGVWTRATEAEDWRQCDSWTHLTAEEKRRIKDTIGGGSGVNTLSPKGRPLVRSTFQMHAYASDEKLFYALLNDLWAFDPDKREWNRMSTSNPPRSDIHTWNLAFDPELNALFSIVGAGSGAGVYVFNRRTRSWALRAPIPTTDFSEVYSAYDSSRRKHVVRAGNKWWTLDLATGETKLIQDLAAAWKASGRPGGPPTTESLSLEYDPQTQLTLAVVGGAPDRREVELWAYDADRDAWSRVALQGDAPNGWPRPHLLVHDPVNACMILVNVLDWNPGGGQVDGVFAFRLRKPAAPGKK